MRDLEHNNLKMLPLSKKETDKQLDFFSFRKNQDQMSNKKGL